MVHFVGAGPGAPDLITVRGKQLLEEADVIIYAGSLVNPKLLEYTKDVCTIHNSANMTLEEVIQVIEKAEKEGKTTVRLSGSKLFLRRRRCLKSGIHPAGYFPERDHHQDGGQDAGSGKGEHPVLCSPQRHYGNLFKHRYAGRVKQKIGRGRL